MNLNYQMDHIQYQLFKIILSILPGGSYSISDIQDYFEYIPKKHSENADNL